MFTEEERNFWSFRPLAAAVPPRCGTRRGYARRSTGSSSPSWTRGPPAESAGRPPRADPPGHVRPDRPAADAEEVDAFVRDPSPDAYERLVDRLLASPHYGERWARHWMDVARFAESHGYEQDYDRPVRVPLSRLPDPALNQDMPFDQFLRWQIAGDELAPDDPQAMAATGFLGAGAFPTQLTEAEFESARYDELTT